MSFGCPAFMRAGRCIMEVVATCGHVGFLIPDVIFISVMLYYCIRYTVQYCLK